MTGRVLIASPLGFVVGFSLGALGAGGSILGVPLLVHLAGQSPADAGTISLFVVTVAAAVGALRHHQAGRVRVDVGLVLALSGTAGSLFGAALARRVDGDLLLLGFALLLLVAAWRMSVSCPGCTRSGETAALMTPAPARRRTREAFSLGRVGIVLAAGTGIGFLTGLFGVGGGFVVIPVLVVVFQVAMPTAIGTSLLVVAINGAVGFVGRALTGPVPWSTAFVFTAAAVVGVAAGARVSERLTGPTLQRGFAVVLVVIAAATGIGAVSGLVSRT